AGPYARWLLVGISSAMVLVLARLVFSKQWSPRLPQLALGLLIGGAAGNLASRVFSARGVVDFIDVGVGTARFWIFNVADIGVTVGACLLAWVIYRSEQPTPR